MTLPFKEDQKRAILFYILKKIEEKNDNISRAVAGTFSINQNTVHTYINELTDRGIIRRVKRGQYELIKEEHSFDLRREKGELDSDIAVYDNCMFPYVKELCGNLQEIWSYAFSEMINNAMEHSLSENVYVTVIRDYLNTTAEITDEGVGIFEKIKGHFRFSSLEEAICELMKGKLTTDPDNHSGEGIFFSSKMMDSFYIFSDGKVFTNNKFDDGGVANLSCERKSGTKVVMSLSNFSEKTPQEIFDLYTNDDGGFTKTTIPLKNIFSASPVSRSQAKRVCNRLDKFREVVLDFEGLSWMGQGFAHQIFVVFERENPEIKLVPVHMEADVEKMYRHVMAER